MLKIKQGNQWTDLPKELTPAIPEGTVEYRFTQTHADIMKNGQRRMLYRNSVALPPIFKVRQGNKTIELGLVSMFDERGNPDGRGVRELSFKPNDNAGMLYLNPSANDDDLEIYQALEWHPEVGGNSNTDESTEKVMIKVDTVGEAKKSREERTARLEAQLHAQKLDSGEELNDAAILLGIDHEKRSADAVRNDVEAHAEKKPTDYLARLNDPNAAVKTSLIKAIRKGIVVVDADALQLRWKANGKEFMPITRTDEVNAATEFAAFVKTEKAGPAVYKTLTNLLTAEK